MVLFSNTELDAIKQCIHDSEKEISGEIRVAFEQSSNSYTGAAMWGGLILMWGITFMYLLIEELFFHNSFIGIFQIHYFILIQAISFILGFFLVKISHRLQRFFTPYSQLRKSSLEKAETIFLEKEIFATRQRSGILIFMSILEHQIIILPDVGLRAKVNDKEWEKIAKNIASSFKKHQAADGIQQAIIACKEILLKHGFEAGPGDQNELSNDVILPRK